MKIYVALAIFSPLIGAFLTGSLGCIWPILSVRLCQGITTFFIGISAVFSLCLLKDVSFGGPIIHLPLFSWIHVENLHVDFSFSVDTLTSIMITLVTVISSMVHVYSIGYMAKDPSLPRFMAYLSLFTFFMLFFVASSNLVQMFLGWECVGFLSYLLIGFWYEKAEAGLAAQKAFVMNRVADLGFILALAMLYHMGQSFEISSIFKNIYLLKTHMISFFGMQLSVLECICILLCIGAMGKSAQIGFHTWLPDAMEGPVPVSALIHAATLVAAGVFLIIKLSPLFEAAPLARFLLVVIGALTAVFASVVAVTQSDIKRVLAYSTCSQIGYMFFAIGLSGYAASMFHLCVHAFFKALLFLGAGSVIRALSNEQDLWKMGGTAKFIPVTYVLMWIGSLSLMGVPFFSGYYSKETILELAWGTSHWAGNFAFLAGFGAMIFTAVYSGKLLFLIFHGKVRADERVMAHIHESPPIMMFPLVFLSIGAILGGYIGYGVFIENRLCFWEGSLSLHAQDIILSHVGHPNWETRFMMYTLPQLMILFGMGLAFIFYVWKPSAPEKLSIHFHELYKVIDKKGYFDEFYKTIFILGSFKVGNFLWRRGDRQALDAWVIGGSSRGVLWISDKVRGIQMGYVPRYIFLMVLGLAVGGGWGLFTYSKPFWNFGVKNSFLSVQKKIFFKKLSSRSTPQLHDMKI